MAIPRNSHYVPGSGRKFVQLPNGDVVPRASAENMAARAIGAYNNYQVKQARNAAKASGMFNSERFTTDRESARATGRLTDKEFATMAAVTSYQAKQGNLDNGPGSPLAFYLWSIGRRSSPVDYSVGETPTV